MISKEQYGEWKNHPATLFFRQFLKDRREHLIHMASEHWLNTGFVTEVDRGRILELFDVEEVPFDVIEIFYQERDNARESSENSPL